MVDRKVWAIVGFLLGFLGVGGVAEASEGQIKANVQRLLQDKACPGCNLAGADLNRVDLSGANLAGANLAGAKLYLANLSDANLKDANLQGVGFGGTDLARADLRGANLTGAVLGGAYLGGAKLDGIIESKSYADQGLPSVQEDVYVADPAKGKQLPYTQEVNVGERRDFAQAPPAIVTETSAEPLASSPAPGAEGKRLPSIAEPVVDKATVPTVAAVAQKKSEEKQAAASAADSPVSLTENKVVAGYKASPAMAPVVLDAVPARGERGKKVTVEEPPSPKPQIAAPAELPSAVRQEKAVREATVQAPPLASSPETGSTGKPPEKPSVPDPSAAAGPDAPLGDAVTLRSEVHMTEQFPQVTPPPSASPERIVEPVSVAPPAPAAVKPIVQQDRPVPAQPSRPDQEQRAATPESDALVQKLRSTKRCAGCQLEQVDLQGARLAMADLERSSLVRANLRGADLEKANLKAADLRGADLRGADLRGADLYRANLAGAQMAGARLEGALLDQADMTGVLKDDVPDAETKVDVEPGGSWWRRIIQP